MSHRIAVVVDVGARNQCDGRHRRLLPQRGHRTAPAAVGELGGVTKTRARRTRTIVARLILLLAVRHRNLCILTYVHRYRCIIRYTLSRHFICSYSFVITLTLGLFLLAFFLPPA